MPESVQCKNCGYLSALDRRDEYPNIIDVDFKTRTEGKVPTYEYGVGTGYTLLIPIYKDGPICFRLVCDMMQDGRDAKSSEDFLRIINTERHCGMFVQWQQGFSPREHMEMDMQSRLLADQQVWQAEQAKLADSRHAESMKIATDSAKTAMRGAYLGAGAAIVSTLLAALLAALFVNQPPPVINVQLPREIPTVTPTGSDADPAK
ncbi:MAG: hypothetical protein AABP62_22155 [Planctomycetota bacterium]